MGDVVDALNDLDLSVEVVTDLATIQACIWNGLIVTVDVITAGIYSALDIPVSPDVIMKLHDGAQDILDGKLEGRATDMFGKSIVEYDLGFCTMLCD